MYIHILIFKNKTAPPHMNVPTHTLAHTLAHLHTYTLTHLDHLFISRTNKICLIEITKRMKNKNKKLTLCSLNAKNGSMEKLIKNF